MTDFLAATRNRIDDRLAELEPVLDEYRRLEEAAAALKRINAKRPPSPQTSARRRATPTRGKSHGKRAQQTLDLIVARPGITISELAAEMGIEPNYLYRVVPRLQADGKVTKRRKGWVAK